MKDELINKDDYPKLLDYTDFDYNSIIWHEPKYFLRTRNWFCNKDASFYIKFRCWFLNLFFSGTKRIKNLKYNA